MKRVSIFIVFIIVILMYSNNVNAKDTLYSINKYTEEDLNFIEKSYNEKGKKDGFIVAGKYLKEDKSESNPEKDYQATIIKYDYNGKKIWEFSYGEEQEDYIDFLTYTYSEVGEVDGYLIAIKKSVPKDNSSEETKEIGVFLKININGKIEWEKEINIENYASIDKVLVSNNENKEFDGYVAIGKINTDGKVNSTIIKFDKELNIVWKKDQNISEENIIYEDIVNIHDDKKIIGYAVIESIKKNEESSRRLIKFDRDGNKEIISEELNKYESSFLAEANNGYILYGLTSDVKVSGGKYSYYLINYDKENKEIWESIGDIAISNEETIKLIPTKENDIVKKYLLLYQNDQDLSKEVIDIDLEGVFQKKVKKISNEYYFLKDFDVEKDILYFIGFITCPEEDNCNYDTHSLFLISDEDKVIEVKDKTVNNISIITISIIVLIGLIIIIRKKKRSEAK